MKNDLTVILMSAGRNNSVQKFVERVIARILTAYGGNDCLKRTIQRKWNWKLRMEFGRLDSIVRRWSSPTSHYGYIQSSGLASGRWKTRIPVRYPKEWRHKYGVSTKRLNTPNGPVRIQRR